MKEIVRRTSETEVRIRVSRGEGRSRVEVEDAFLRHMLETFARYSGLDLEVEAEGDLRHHLVEDVGLTLGVAIRDLAGENVARFGWCLLPMDETLAEAAIDVGGRPYFVGEAGAPLYTHFLHSFAMNLDATLHVRVIRGGDRHHVVEAVVKAVGTALKQALVEQESIFSTKGRVRMERGEEGEAG